ncbi:hypothetical protein APHAL10511_008723 [Amanita phalloides]|nr:hypothetical protein APHAL10511_008723 [Amanita phalloides]
MPALPDAPPLVRTTVDADDESVRIAVSALGDMRNAAPRTRSPPSPSSAPSPSLVSRVSHLPLVHSVLRTYEQGKASSRVVKYGAEMMESSVRTISRPVIDRLPVNVNQIDEFACRQLDRLDRYRRMSTGESTNPPSVGSPDSLLRSPEMLSSGAAMTDSYASEHPFSPDSRSSTPTFVGEETLTKAVMYQSETTGSPSETQNLERQVAQRSRWQAVLLEAGGLSAALSDENMRRLKYCLHCLQYATAQIDAQILILRDFIAGLQPLPPASSSPSRRPISQAHIRTLTDVRRDLVHTIRQVVDVVSKYAGGALPEPARTRVRGFILKLPQRWASKAGVGVPNVSNGAPSEGDRETVTAAASGSGAVRRPNRRAAYRERGAGADSRASSRAPSPSSPRISRSAYPVVDTAQTAGSGSRDVDGNGSCGEPAVSTGAAVLAAQRILTLATESLDMMRGVTGVMKDSLDRADAWVNRLRTVGIQRNETGGEVIQGEAPRAPSPTRHHGRGSSSTTRVEDDREGDCSSGLASPTISVAGSVSGSSTAYSSTYNAPSGTSTPGGSKQSHSPSVLPIVPLGAMSLDGKRWREMEDMEHMDVDV